MITIALISIFVITGLAWVTRNFLRFPICPICAGVAGTWGWMLVARFIGISPTLTAPEVLVILALLMGGSVVGISYQIEKRLPKNRSPLLWKILFIPIGFLTVWSTLNAAWWTLGIAGAAIVFFSIIFFFFAVAPKSQPEPSLESSNETVERIKKDMEKCC